MKTEEAQAEVQRLLSWLRLVPQLGEPEIILKARGWQVSVNIRFARALYNYCQLSEIIGRRLRTINHHPSDQMISDTKYSTR